MSSHSGTFPIAVTSAPWLEDRLAGLHQTYPAWRISRPTRSDGTLGLWWAVRHAPLTEAQRAAGLWPSIARGDIVALVMEISVQDDIAHRMGYAP